jgi:hypothetical protein
MHSLNQVNKLVSCGRDPARSLPFWRGFLLIPLILVCFAFAPQTQAITPTPDGCYPSLTTAEGCFALFSATPGGVANTGLGWATLFANSTGNSNTAVGAAALLLNTGDGNTASGTAALFSNGTGHDNAAFGTFALLNNTGSENTAVGSGALENHTILAGAPAQVVDANVAVGTNALFHDIDSFSNNAYGNSAMFANRHAANNTAVGDLALAGNDASQQGAANNNVGVGAQALIGNVNGSENTVVGTGAGGNLTDGFNNTYVGDFVGSTAADEDSTIRIGDISNGNGAGSLECFIGGIFNNEQHANGSNIVVVTLDLNDDHLGFDPTIHPGAGTNPYKSNRSVPQPRTRPQAGHQAQLNELQATVAQQQKQIEALTAQLKEQAAQLQKVSAQVEMIRPTPRVVENR